MAGYNTGGEFVFRNATVINSQADAVAGQRKAFSERNNNGIKSLGAANMTQINAIFNHPNGPTGQETKEDGVIKNQETFMTAILDTFKALDLNAQDADIGGNPDFSGQVSMDYRNAERPTPESMQTLSDKPHVFGPNTFVQSNQTFDSSTTRETQSELKEVSLVTGGFGYKTTRNFLGNDVLGNYFSKHYTAEGNNAPVKGEYEDDKTEAGDPLSY